MFLTDTLEQVCKAHHLQIFSSKSTSPVQAVWSKKAESALAEKTCEEWLPVPCTG